MAVTMRWCCPSTAESGNPFDGVAKKIDSVDTHPTDYFAAPVTKHYSMQLHVNVAAELEALGFSAAFNLGEIKPWRSERFEVIENMGNSCENHGQVRLMWDTKKSRHVVVKFIPKTWMGASNVEFTASHPQAIELPWQDLSVVKFLSSIGFPYVSSLLGVFEDDTNIAVVTSFATEGNLLQWCHAPVSNILLPGPKRESFVRPLIVNLLLAVEQLHELSIVHGYITMESILLSEMNDHQLHLQIAEFGQASTSRYFRKCAQAKSPYRAPELYEDGPHDGFLSDAFSVGVTLFIICLRELPWLSTNGDCKSFAYMRRRGFHAYASKRKLRHLSGTVADHVSEELMQVLAGLLELNPAKRHTLGESVWPVFRRSVWDEEWIQGHIDHRTWRELMMNAWSKHSHLAH